LENYYKAFDAYDNGLPAPKVYEIIEHNRRFGLVMERVQGITLKDDPTNHGVSGSDVLQTRKA